MLADYTNFNWNCEYCTNHLRTVCLKRTYTFYFFTERCEIRC